MAERRNGSTDLTKKNNHHIYSKLHRSSYNSVEDCRYKDSGVYESQEQIMPAQNPYSATEFQVRRNPQGVMTSQQVIGTDGVMQSLDQFNLKKEGVSKNQRRTRNNGHNMSVDDGVAGHHQISLDRFQSSQSVRSVRNNKDKNDKIKV